MDKHDRKDSDGIQGMGRRTFLKLSGSAVLGLAGAGLGRDAFAVPKPSRPNVLLILTDQQHIDTISAAGCPYLKTPALDQLVQSGVVFPQSYCGNPVCSPSRSAIFSGRTSSETGVYANNRPIRPDIPNLGQWFSERAGYETVYAGKWHLPRGYTHFIPGFEVIHTGIGGQGNLGDAGVSCACEGYLRGHSSSAGPFLLVASFLQPHDVCEWLRLNREDRERLLDPELRDELPPLPENFEFDRREPKHLKRTRRTREPGRGHWGQTHWRYYRWSYYRHVEMVDAEIGRILRALQETGHDRDTLVVFTADHGEGLAHHQMVRKSLPYDEAIRVPLIVSWPGHLPEGRTDAHIVSGLDIVPTLCDFAGIDPPERMRGQNLRPLLEGRSAPQRPGIVSELPGNMARMVRTERYKFIAYAGDPVELLFDMQNDPGETVSLAADPAYASVLDEHRRLLLEWERRLDVAPNLPCADAWWKG